MAKKKVKYIAPPWWRAYDYSYRGGEAIIACSIAASIVQFLTVARVRHDR